MQLQFCLASNRKKKFGGGPKIIFYSNKFVMGFFFFVNFFNRLQLFNAFLYNFFPYFLYMLVYMHSACIFIFFQISQSMIQNDFFSRFFSFCIIKNLFYIILFFFLLLSIAVVVLCPLTHWTGWGGCQTNKCTYKGCLSI